MSCRHYQNGEADLPRLDKPSEFIVSSTEKDDHGHALGVEELEKYARLTNEEPYSAPYLVEHDRSVAAVGKILSARTVSEINRVVLYSTVAPYKPTSSKVLLSNGTLLFEEVCDDARPTLGFGAHGFSANFRVHIDPTDFDETNLKQFERDVQKLDPDAEITAGVKKGLGVETVITLIIGKIGQKLLDKTADKTLRCADDSAKRIWNGCIESIKLNGKKRDVPISQNIVIEHDPIIELHHKDDNPETMSGAFGRDAVEKMLELAAEAKEKTNAIRVHFEWLSSTWSIHHVDTADGKQWLTKRATEEREEKLKAQEKFLEDNNLSGGHSINVLPKNLQRKGDDS